MNKTNMPGATITAVMNILIVAIRIASEYAGDGEVGNWLQVLLESNETLTAIAVVTSGFLITVYLKVVAWAKEDVEVHTMTRGATPARSKKELLKSML